MLHSGRRSLAVALTAAALGLSACGSDEEATIPPENADALLTQLDAVEKAISDRDCSTAQTDISQLTGSVNGLPAEVGEETKTALRGLVENLSQLTEDQCEEPDTGVTGETEPVETETETTAPATTSTTTTTTSTSTSEEEGNDDEGTGLPGSGNGPPGPEGNPNDDNSSEGEGD